jgi:SAM-dependent methyltransferase
MSKVDFLDLGMQPIANNFLSNIDEGEFKYNLSVTFDDVTKLVSLKEFVKPELMFNENYVYHSSNSETMRTHFLNTAEKLKNEFSPLSVLEIGSNDGVFLKNFTPDIAISVEPCSNFAEKTRELGYDTYDEFWDLKLGAKIESEHGKQDLIYSANCVCHFQDLKNAFDTVYNLLSDDGIFIFEDPSLVKMLERNSYDQIYDEHAHIFSVTALDYILNKSNLQIFKVENLDIHGGSNRIYVCKSNTRQNDISVEENLHREEKLGINSIGTYLSFAKAVEQSKFQLLSLLAELKRQNYKIVSYGATSKSTTVFNYCNITTDLIDYIVDTTEAKQGKFMPGVHIPVVSHNDNFDNSVDYAFLGAWNYENEIVAKEDRFLAYGRFITHVPYVRFI